MSAIENGWYRHARVARSPNYNDRPANTLVSLLVIHNISLPPGEYDNTYIEQFFQNVLPVGAHPYFKTIEKLQVSAHCVIRRGGEVVQFVSFDHRAWHAGVSVFENRENCNDYSIGIELEGTDTEPYTTEQYRSLGTLTKSILRQFPAINAVRRIVGHSDISPNRKTDPGPAFDWPYYYSLLNDAH
ncbi:1,6-anhydro-N-acetylmuramyl-L-alanine amidase AmpD [Teredinibacter purpureus]|uniref:1,6-anhydro-N-acetylmuramyl-L-alanine amidase AmpD n=1 Tax=Teredinibacter purpureus TaxID=2731756 RepID=UPI0005F813FC|nr:1,6-anhydro-N-acetylmuramyl-L-alanine amidase AmpD [Teredinibacter purpureus]